jgi:hypothetical protein
MSKLGDLQEGKCYTITFDISLYSERVDIIEIQVLIKLENTIKLKFIDTNKTIWYQTNKGIKIFDEIPLKYYRKEKLQKINDINED